MGGKSQDNSAITNEQQAQAADARAKDEARKARIDAGINALKDAFYGKAKYTTKSTPGTVLGASGALPAGYTRVTTGGTAAAAPRRQTSGNPNSMLYNGGSDSQGNPVNTRATSSPGVVKVRGPDGKMYNVGETVGGGSEQVFTGREAGGFDDNYYNEYNKGVQDYLLPQVTDQYTDAKKKSEYDLARAGTSKSSVSNEVMADLTKQKETQEADARKTADTATGALRTRVADEEAKLRNQLYATENLDSDQVLSRVKNIALDTPEVSPLGDIFKTALIGGANAITGFKNQQQINDIRAGGVAKPTNVVRSG
jgi:hypothetical protein